MVFTAVTILMALHLHYRRRKVSRIEKRALEKLREALGEDANPV